MMIEGTFIVIAALALTYAVILYRQHQDANRAKRRESLEKFKADAQDFHQKVKDKLDDK